MEKQRLEDEIIEEVLKYFDTDKFSDYQLNYVKNIMFNTIIEACQGMIKIEDVNNLFDKLIMKHKELKEFYKFEIEFKQSLKELGEK
jgi:hypothetical protein